MMQHHRHREERSDAAIQPGRKTGLLRLRLAMTQHSLPLVPAQAGTQRHMRDANWLRRGASPWMPACAGMTAVDGARP